MAASCDRDLIYGYRSKATFLGKRHVECMHMTSLCPDRCNHATDVFMFKIDEVSVVDPGSKHSKFCKPIKAGDTHHVGTKDLGEFKNESLVEGDMVELDWNHDYVTRAGASFPERPVTRLVALSI